MTDQVGTNLGALTGVRVVDVSAYVAAPYAATLMADMGADIIKVEPPEGDNLRNYPSTLDQECRFFVGTNRGKRSIALDLKKPEGLAILERLVAEADVFVHNFRPGVAERLGIGYEKFASRHPRLIYAVMTAYGESGPLQKRPGYDQVLQSMTGLCAGQADPGGPPHLVHGSLVDYYAATVFALGIVSALYERERSGKGQRMGASLLSSALCMQAGRFVWSESEPLKIDRNVRSVGVNGIFPTKEGHLYLQATTPHFWTSLCRLLGCDDMAVNPDYDSVRKRLNRKDEVAARITEALSQRTAEEWEVILSEELPSTVVRSLEDLFEHPQVVEQGLVTNYVHPTIGSYKGFSNPISFGRSKAPETRAAPMKGQHTVEVLKQVGFDDDAVEEFRKSGVVF